MLMRGDIGWIADGWHGVVVVLGIWDGVHFEWVVVIYPLPTLFFIFVELSVKLALLFTDVVDSGLITKITTKTTMMMNNTTPEAIQRQFVVKKDSVELPDPVAPAADIAVPIDVGRCVVNCWVCCGPAFCCCCCRGILEKLFGIGLLIVQESYYFFYCLLVLVYVLRFIPKISWILVQNVEKISRYFAF